MSDTPAKSKPTRGKAPNTGRGANRIMLGIWLGAVAVIGALGLWYQQRQAQGVPASQAPAGTAQDKSSTNSSDLQKLNGRWRRPDGGYILEIKSVDPDGRLEAAYFNPKPIHVARAQALRQDSVVKVFVELRDVNYPGSTYSLAYDPASDQLQGNYFQAALGQNFDVYFERTQ